jgi:hypothetical protein
LGKYWAALRTKGRPVVVANIPRTGKGAGTQSERQRRKKNGVAEVCSLRANTLRKGSISSYLFISHCADTLLHVSCLFQVIL